MTAKQEEHVTDIVMTMPADTPAKIQELAKQILGALEHRASEGPPVEAMGTACLFIACAYIAAIEDDDLRNTIVEEMGELAAACIRASREELTRKAAVQ
jgi:hypothetical protein